VGQEDFREGSTSCDLRAACTVIGTGSSREEERGNEKEAMGGRRREAEQGDCAGANRKPLQLGILFFECVTLLAQIGQLALQEALLGHALRILQASKEARVE